MTKARRSLSKRIHELQGSQRVYTPGIADLLDASQEDERLEDQPEVLKLWLPSQLSDDDRSAWCLPGISHLEFRFRYAQASDALAELRRLRRLFQGTRDQNAKHTKSTSTTTRSQGVLDKFHGRIKRVANRYRDARRALLVLDPEEESDAAGWKHCFLELKDADIRGPDREIYESSEGRFQQSWIWTVTRPLSDPSNSISSDPQPSVVGVDEKELHQSHRAHWARAQARAERYEEEVKLTVEEMGRTLRYFEWKRSWWQSISPERNQSNDPPALNVQDGLCAYAHRQSHMYDKLVTLFVNHWRGFLSAHSLGSSWLCNYSLDVHPVPPARPRRGHRESDGDLPTIDSPRRPTAPLETTRPLPEGNATPQKSTSSSRTPFPTPDDPTDAPLDSGSSDEGSDDDFSDDDSWGEDSANDD